MKHETPRQEKCPARHILHQWPCYHSITIQQSCSGDWKDLQQLHLNLSWNLSLFPTSGRRQFFEERVKLGKLITAVLRPQTSTALAQVSSAKTRFFKDCTARTTTRNCRSCVAASGCSSRMHFSKVTRSVCARSAQKWTEEILHRNSKQEDCKGRLCVPEKAQAIHAGNFITGCSDFFGCCQTRITRLTGPVLVHTDRKIADQDGGVTFFHRTRSVLVFVRSQAAMKKSFCHFAHTGIDSKRQDHNRKPRSVAF